MEHTIIVLQKFILERPIQQKLMFSLWQLFFGRYSKSINLSLNAINVVIAPSNIIPNHLTSIPSPSLLPPPFFPSLQIVFRTMTGTYLQPYGDHPHLTFDFQIIIQTAKKGLRPSFPEGTPEHWIQVIELDIFIDTVL